MRYWAHLLLVGLVCSLLATQAMAQQTFRTAEEVNKLLGRGINLGNALEAPSEGAWGITLEAGYFEAIAKAGFQSVRIPTRWSAHSLSREPYTIDPKFLRRVDWAIEVAQKNKLAIVLNVHHFDEVYLKPEEKLPQLAGIWKQLAEHYKDLPDNVVFEILNEPHTKLDADNWNKAIVQLLGVIRATNPKRVVMVGPTNWNNPHFLPGLKLPADDKQLIVTFHYYNPFEFTHQGAEWATDSQKWLGRKWTGSATDVKALREDLDRAAKWGEENKRPLFLGEFGAYNKADMASRALWAKSVAREAEARGFSWAYWEFCSGFGAYDPATKSWRPELKAALVEK